MIIRSTDDYKVIIGFKKTINEERTLFYVLTLKSNSWKVLRQVVYGIFTKISGFLCGGALHWFMLAGEKKVIMSLDLSTEECKEIPQPAEAEHESCQDLYDHRLGVLKGCLCIYSYFSPSPMSSKIWVLKNNKWELYINNNDDFDVAHWFIPREVLVDSQNRSSYVYTVDYVDLCRAPGNIFALLCL